MTMGNRKFDHWYHVLSFILLVTTLTLNAQKQDSVFYIVEQGGEFLGEDPSDSFRKYLGAQSDSIRHHISDSISGMIVINFTVDSTGKTRNPTIIRGINYEIDAIVIQIILDSPKWTPCRDKGKPVDCMYNFPFYVNYVHVKESYNESTKEKPNKKRRERKKRYYR